MRLALVPLLLLSAFAVAAEPLEGKSLDETYIPAGLDCRTAAKGRTSGNCPADPATRAVEEAEAQATGRDPASKAITTHPLPPAPQMPVDDLSPHQRMLMDQIKSIPDQIQR